MQLITLLRNNEMKTLKQNFALEFFQYLLDMCGSVEFGLVETMYTHQPSLQLALPQSMGSPQRTPNISSTYSYIHGTTHHVVELVGKPQGTA